MDYNGNKGDFFEKVAKYVEDKYGYRFTLSKKDVIIYRHGTGEYHWSVVVHFKGDFEKAVYDTVNSLLKRLAEKEES